MQDLEKQLTKEEIELIKNDTDDTFYFINFNNIFEEIEEYCDENYLNILDKQMASVELIEFIKNNTNILQNIYYKNLLDEIDYKNDLEDNY